MLVVVQCSKKLPFGGALTDSDLDGVHERLAAAIVFASRQNEPVWFDTEARERWLAVYDDLSDGHPGLWGAATVRLAMLYARLVCSPSIRIEHLNAARSRSGITPPAPRTGSSATRSATRPPTKSGRWPRPTRRASPARRSATSSAATRRLARSTGR